MAIQTRSIDRIIGVALDGGISASQPISSILGMAEEELQERCGRDTIFDQKIQDAVAVLEFVRNTSASVIELEAECQRMISAAEDVEAAARQAHIEAIRDHEAKNIRLEVIRENGVKVTQENFNKILRDFSYIKANPALRNVEIVGGSNPAIRITPYPLVLEDEGVCYRLDNLQHDISFNDLSVTFTGACESSVHPHIDYCGVICWGEADKHIRTSRNLKDFVGLSRLITDWMTQYNPASPYVKIDQFDAINNQPTGWEIPA